MSEADLPIATLLRERSTALGLSPGELAKRIGYGNVSKTMRRLDELGAGDLAGMDDLLDRLPTALEVSRKAFDDVMRRTRELFDERRIREAEQREAAWRAAFVPHALMHTEHQRPTQISMCAMTGGPKRWLHIAFAPDTPPVEFVAQARAAIAARTMVNAAGEQGTLFFGRVLGFVVNYTPDRAVRFDLAGTPLEVLPAAYRLGTTTLSIGGRTLTDDEVTLVFPSFRQGGPDDGPHSDPAEM